MAERVGFEPTCRNYPTIRFRVGAVMTTSVPLRARTLLRTQIRAAPRGAYSSRTMTRAKGRKIQTSRRGFVALGLAVSRFSSSPGGRGISTPTPDPSPPPSRPAAGPPATATGGRFPRPYRDPPAAPALALRERRARYRPLVASSRGSGLPGIPLAARGRFTSRRPGRDDADAADRQENGRQQRVFTRTRTSSPGARYLAYMKERIPGRIHDPDRTWMAMAAYNIGIGHLEDARIITQMRKKNPDRWTDVRANLPRLSDPHWHSRVKRGYANGNETVAIRRTRVAVRRDPREFRRRHASRADPAARLVSVRGHPLPLDVTHARLEEPGNSRFSASAARR